jgi:RNA polymerase sigma-70 factor (ECF subfamily)
MGNELGKLTHEEFSALTEPLRHEIRLHCYRMMGCLDDAEDMVQETFVKAWKRRETYAGLASVRAWLYKIATNSCLDALEKKSRRVIPMTRQPSAKVDDPIPASVMEPIWLEPIPDDWVDTANDTPESAFANREHIRLAFLTALHLLPPRQRAVLILRDVLDWQASEVAALLEVSVPAVKSALHRARTTLAEHPQEVTPTPILNEQTQNQLKEYVHAWETADVDMLLRLLTEDATFSMPPIPSWYQGVDAIAQLLRKTVFGGGGGVWRLLSTRANGQLAFGLYRRTDVPNVYTGYGIQVLTYRQQQIADIITFRSPGMIKRFGLAETLET